MLDCRAQCCMHSAIYNTMLYMYSTGLYTAQCYNVEQFYRITAIVLQFKPGQSRHYPLQVHGTTASKMRFPVLQSKVSSSSRGNTSFQELCSYTIRDNHIKYKKVFLCLQKKNFKGTVAQG